MVKSDVTHKDSQVALIGVLGTRHRAGNVYFEFLAGPGGS
jgi:hypothetical protein